MERRYLTATVAMVVAFVFASHAFRSENVSLLLHPRTALVAELKCATKTISNKLASKMPSVLRAGDPEEAQLLAEMNLPATVAQAKIDAAQATLEAQKAKLDAIRAKFDAVPTPAAVKVSDSDCPQVRRARQAAEQAQRAAERVRVKMENEKMSYVTIEGVPPAVDVEVSLPAGFEQRAAARAIALQSRLAAQAIQLQVRADAMQRLQTRLANIKMKEIQYKVISTQSVTGLSASSARCASQPGARLDNLRNDVMKKLTVAVDSSSHSL